MKLEEAIAEVQQYPNLALRLKAIQLVLTAIASGDLIPLADHRLAVALMVLKAKDAVIAADSAFEVAYGSCERILALANADALAEVRALKAAGCGGCIIAGRNG